VSFVYHIDDNAYKLPAYPDVFGRRSVGLEIADRTYGIASSEPAAYIIYEEGDVIYTRQGADVLKKYFHVKLAHDELYSLLAGLELDKLAALKDLPHNLNYEPFADNDDHVSEMQECRFAFTGQQRSYFTFTGNLWQFGRRTQAPAELLNIFDELTQFNSHDATEWLPDEVRISFRCVDDRPEMYKDRRVYQWPARLPDLSAPATIYFPSERGRNSSDVYNIRTGKEQLDEFRRFYASMKDYSLVEICGRKGFLRYGLTFPV